MPTDPLVHDIADRPQLFLDDTLIADAVGLQRRVHQLVKVSDEPVLRSTEPWEGEWTAPAGVSFDEAAGHWRMWYVTSGRRRAKVAGVHEESLHLAVSPDGVRWEKRPLGLLSIDGGAGNNICVFEDGRPVPGAVTVLDEPGDPDPSKRYKLIWYGPNYYLAWSADGVRWRPAQAEPVWPNGAGDGLEETAFFFRDSLAGKYAGYMRVWRRHQTIRKNGRGESDDMVNWTGPKICWEAQPHFGPGAQLYGMHVHVDAGVYWAFPWVFYTSEPLREELRQTIRLKLGYSRDGWEWHAPVPLTDIVPMGEHGKSFDGGMMISHCPAVLTEREGWLYYIGCSGLHHEGDDRRAVGLAKWRRGGLVSLSTGDAPFGGLLTRRFLFRGRELRINARTLEEGYVKAELIDDSGNVVAGCSIDECDPFVGDEIDHVLTWRGSGDLSRLYGQYLMLRMRLDGADLYSFRAAGPKERLEAELGPPPVRAGRCGVAPTIDGVLKEECWMDFTHSGVAADFVRFERVEPASVRTRALFTYDDTNLYIAVECEEPNTDRLPPSRGGGPISYSDEDVIEVRLSGPPHGTHFHQLMVSSSGGTEHNWFSKEAGGIATRPAGGWRAAARVLPGHWCTEIAVPWAELTAPAPKPGEAWRLNLIRYRNVTTEPGTKDWSCWSCMHGSVHRNDVAGTMVFG